MKYSIFVINKIGLIGIIVFLLISTDTVGQKSLENLDLNGHSIIFGNKQDVVTDMIQDYQGRLLMAANMEYDEKKTVAALVIFNEINGKVKTYNDIRFYENYDGCTKIIQLPNQQFLLIAYKIEQETKTSYLVWLDEKGEEIDNERVGQAGEDELKDAIVSSDGYIVAVGFRTINNKRFPWIIKKEIDSPKSQLKSNLSIWENINFLFETNDQNENDEFIAISEGENGYYAIVGTKYISEDTCHPLFLKISHAGMLANTTPLPQEDLLTSSPKDIVKLPNSGYAIIGNAKVKQGKESQFDIWMALVDEQGTMHPREYQYYNAGKNYNNDYLGEALFLQNDKLGMVGHTAAIKYDPSYVPMFFSSFEINKKRISDKSKIPDFSFHLQDSSLSYIHRRSNNEEVQEKICQLTNGWIVISGKEKSKNKGIQLYIASNKKAINETKTPQLSIAKFQLIDENKNNILDKQEEAYISLEIENNSNINAHGLTAKLFSESIQCNSEVIHIGQVLGGQSIRFGFRVSQTNDNAQPLDKLFIHFTTIDGTIIKDTVTIYLREMTGDFAQIDWKSFEEDLDVNKIPIVEKDEVTIQFKVKSDVPLSSKNITIYLNEELVKSDKSGETSLKGGQHNFTVSRLIKGLKLGENIIKIYIQNREDLVISEPLIINYQNNKPNLYIFSVGITYDESFNLGDLNYTDDDASQFSGQFKLAKDRMEGSLFGKVNIVDPIVGDVTARDIKLAIAKIQSKINYEIKENDLLILYLSGHGDVIDNSFKLLASDFDEENIGTLEITTVDYQNNIIKILNKIVKCRKMIFLDACHSGGATSSILDGTFTTFSSSTTEETSMEHDNWENGAFTEAILEAFQNVKSEGLDKDNNIIQNLQATTDDNILTLGELIEYTQLRVPKLIKDLNLQDKEKSQHPTLSDITNKELLNIPIYIIE